MKTLFNNARQWHWISAAFCALGMLFFSWTGITLNHAADISTTAKITTLEIKLPDDLLQHWRLTEKIMLNKRIRSYLLIQHQLFIPEYKVGEYSGGEFYLAMPEPGVDAWLSIDSESGELIYERSDRGWVSFFNDLHKGRYTNAAWQWFIDIFAAGCIIFCLSGLLLLYKQSTFRLSTWPLVSFGVLLPLVIILTNLH